MEDIRSHIRSQVIHDEPDAKDEYTFTFFVILNSQLSIFNVLRKIQKLVNYKIVKFLKDNSRKFLQLINLQFY